MDNKMDNKKQTSVEWLANEINAIVPPGHELKISFLLEKATQMANEERADVYTQAFKDASRSISDAFSKANLYSNF